MFEGGQPAGLNSLPAYVAALEQSRVKDADIVDSLELRLQREGYLDARVAITDSTLAVEAGPRAHLAEITIAETDRVFDFDGVPFTSARLETAINQVLSDSYEAGYYYARAQISEIHRSSNLIYVSLTTLPGPVVEVAQTNLLGLKRTNRDAIMRYLPLIAGDTLTEKKVVQTEAEASRIPFVQFLPPAELKPRPGYTETDIDLHFREYPAVTILGGAGYVPTDGGRLVWSLDLNLRNLFGSGREIGILTDRRESNRTTLQLNYRQPLFVGGRGQLSVGVATRDYRDDFYEFALNSGYQVSLSQSFSSSIDLSWRRVDPTEIGPLNPSFSVYQVGFGVSRANLDDEVNPSRGARLEANISYVYRRFTGRAQTDSAATSRDALNETRSRIRAEWFLPVTGSVVLRLTAAYSGLESSDGNLPLSELQLLGGPPTLRGYRNEQFAGKRAAWSSVEPRVRYSSGYLFLFYDAAYINRQSTTVGDGLRAELFRDSFGLGLLIVDENRSARLSIGWNGRDKENQPRLSIELSAGL